MLEAGHVAGARRCVSNGCKPSDGRARRVLGRYDARRACLFSQQRRRACVSRALGAMGSHECERVAFGCLELRIAFARKNTRDRRCRPTHATSASVLSCEVVSLRGFHASTCTRAHPHRRLCLVPILRMVRRLLLHLQAWRLPSSRHRHGFARLSFLPCTIVVVIVIVIVVGANRPIHPRCDASQPYVVPGPPLWTRWWEEGGREGSRGGTVGDPLRYKEAIVS